MGLDRWGPGSESAVDAVQAGHDLTRDTKVAVSVPVIVGCGVGLGVVLMGLFMLEAFVSQVYEGFGKEVVVSIGSLSRCGCS